MSTTTPASSFPSFPSSRYTSSTVGSVTRGKVTITRQPSQPSDHNMQTSVAARRAMKSALSSNKDKENTSANVSSRPLKSSNSVSQPSKAPKSSVPVVDRLSNASASASLSLSSSFPDSVSTLFPSVDETLIRNSLLLESQPGGIRKPENAEIQAAEAALAEVERQLNDRQPEPSVIDGLPEDIFVRSVLPLRRENLRLMKLNNQLNMHLIRENENAEDRETKLISQLRVMKGQHADLTFLTSQKQRKIHLMEQEMNEMRLRMEKMLAEKQFFVREALEATSAIPANGAAGVPTSAAAAYVAAAAASIHSASRDEVHALRAAEEKVRELQSEVNELRREHSELEGERGSWESKLWSREREIERLSGLLENERNWDRIQSETAVALRDSEIAKLNQQLDFLNDQYQRQNALLQRNGLNQDGILKEIEAKQRECEYLSGKLLKSGEENTAQRATIESLERKLKAAEVDRSNLSSHWESLIKEKQLQFEAVQGKYQGLVNELELKSIEIQSLEQQLAVAKAKLPNRPLESLEEELHREKSALQALRERYSNVVKENEERFLTINQLKEELKSLKSSANRDTQELKSELLRIQGKYEDLVRRYGSTQDQSLSLGDEKEKLANELDLTKNSIRLVESELNYYREMSVSLQETNRSHLEAIEEKSKEVIAATALNQRQSAELKELQKEKVALLSELQQFQSVEKQLKLEKNQWLEEKAQLNSTLAFLRGLNEENSRNMANLSDLSVEKKGLLRQLEKQKITIDSLIGEKDELFDKYSRLGKEKQELIGALAEIEKQLITIQMEVKSLTEERDSTRQLYEQVVQELKSMEKGERGWKERIGALQQEIAVLMKEKEELKLALQSREIHSSAKSDSLQAKQEEIQLLKLEKQRISNELDRAEGKIMDLQRDLSNLQSELKERGHFASEVESSKREIHLQLANTAAENSQLRGTVDELKALVKRLEKSKDAFVYEISELNQELESQKRELQRVSSERQALHSDFQLAKGEIERLRLGFSEIEDRNGRLLEEKNSVLLEMERIRSSKVVSQQSNEQLAVLVEQNQARAAALEAELSSKERKLQEFLSREKQFHESNLRLEEEMRLKSVEIKGILDDLHNLLKENQAISRELNALKVQRDSKAEELERAMSQIQHWQEVGKMKEREIAELLTNYRSVCLENERLKGGHTEFEAERISLRGQLKAAQEAAQRLEMAVTALENEKVRRSVDLQAYERQLEDMNRALEGAREAAHQARLSAERSQADLNASRSMSAGFEQNRIDFTRREMEYKAQIQRLNSEILAYKGDLQSLQSALKIHRERSESLENALNQLRMAGQKDSTKLNQMLEEKIKSITDLNFALSQAKNQAESLQDQVNSLIQQRDRQAAEILRLTNALAQAGSSDSQKDTAASDALMAQIQAYQATIAQLNELLEAGAKEKQKLRTFLFKYESEIQRLESTQGNQSQSMHASFTAAEGKSNAPLSPIRAVGNDSFASNLNFSASRAAAGVKTPSSGGSVSSVPSPTTPASNDSHNSS